MTRMIQIICVEDEPMIRELLPRALELAGMKVTMIYRTGEELLSQREMAAYKEAELFIFDVRLPGMTGLELATQLRAEGEQRPIIAASAWPMPKDVDLEKIRVTYLRKPFDFPELHKLIQDLVEES